MTAADSTAGADEAAPEFLSGLNGIAPAAGIIGGDLAPSAAEPADKTGWWSPAGVKSTFWRRVAMCMVFPVALVVMLPGILLVPFIAFGRAARKAWWEFCATFTEEPLDAIWLAWRMVWSAKYHTDRDAALKEARG